ncbi:MAG: hypothetical protein LBQ93_00990 [Treponema sp.]|jgi:hypothetical protein|nr:hypothetical protein [Treponema sp.]
MILKYTHARNLITSLFFCLILSCSHISVENLLEKIITDIQPEARPMAILQTGEQPLWFQLTEGGPVLLESIEDAIFSAALVPWPLALHIRFFHEREGELVMAINRDGFIKLAPFVGKTEGLAMYRFGHNFWRQYTVGGFVFYDDKPAALLYLDNRFLDSSAPIPVLRTWTFEMDSNMPFPLEIPALEFFPVEEGWSADTLRLGYNGFWYYRVRKSGSLPEIRMLRTDDLSRAGEEISTEEFFNSAPRTTETFYASLLPPLPEGFFYTGTGIIGDSLFASWEEQADYNIGAAGFMVIKR